MICDDGAFEIREMVRIMLRILLVQMFHHRQLLSVHSMFMVPLKQHHQEIRDADNTANLY